MFKRNETTKPPSFTTEPQSIYQYTVQRSWAPLNFPAAKTHPLNPSCLLPTAVPVLPHHRVSWVALPGLVAKPKSASAHFSFPTTLNGSRGGEKPARGSWSKCNVQDSTLIQSPLNGTLCCLYFSMSQGKVTSMIYTLLFFKPQLTKRLYDNNKLTFTVQRCLKNCYTLIQVRT